MNTLRTAAAVIALLLPGAAAVADPAPSSGPAKTVHIKNFAFVPTTLTVPAGTTITFVNDDEEPHTATAVDKSFDSEALDTGKRWSHVFSKAGTIKYFCELHPMMKGQIVVTKAEASQ